METAGSASFGDQDTGPAWPWSGLRSASTYGTLVKGLKLSLTHPMTNREAVSLARAARGMPGARDGQLAWWQWTLPAYDFDSDGMLVVTAKQAITTYGKELEAGLWEWLTWSASVADQTSKTPTVTLNVDSFAFFDRTTLQAITDAVNADVGKTILPVPQMPPEWKKRIRDGLKDIVGPVSPIFRDPFGLRRLGDVLWFAALLYVGLKVLGDRTVFDD